MCAKRYYRDLQISTPVMQILPSQTLILLADIPRLAGEQSFPRYPGGLFIDAADAVADNNDLKITVSPRLSAGNGRSGVRYFKSENRARLSLLIGRRVHVSFSHRSFFSDRSPPRGIANVIEQLLESLAFLLLIQASLIEKRRVSVPTLSGRRELLCSSSFANPSSAKSRWEREDAQERNGMHSVKLIALNLQAFDFVETRSGVYHRLIASASATTRSRKPFSVTFGRLIIGFIAN